jgi:hypothetical protein
VRRRILSLAPSASSRRAGHTWTGGSEPTVNERRRRADPRIVATIAIFLAVAAIALELAYTVGRFAMSTVEQIHS